MKRAAFPHVRALRAAPRVRRAFTLVEVLIVMAVVAVLVALAGPLYTEQVARGRRAEARVQLLLAAQYMQRFYTANDSYAAARDGTAVSDAMPAPLRVSPAQGTALYRLGLGDGQSTATATDFRLVMSPVPGERMADDRCGGFTLDSAGRRGVTGGESLSSCWN